MEQDFWRLHVSVCCGAANQNSETTGIFLRFQTEERVLRVNKSKITDENTFSGDHFEIEGNQGSIKDEKTLFWVFCRFVTSALTLRLQNTYLYVFGALFGIYIFKPLPVVFGS